MKIATCQIPDIQNDLDKSLYEIQKLAEEANVQGVKLICFPECFLQGYTREEGEARQRALDLSSSKFTEILSQLASCRPMLIFGMIELNQNTLFNTAIVVNRGKLIGAYRKTHPNEKIYRAGTTYSTFEIDGYKFGINICNDANFEEAAAKLVEQGANMILYLLNNMLPRDVAERWRTRHIENLFQRAKQTGSWVVSADVVGERNDCIGYGCTAIVNPDGDLIERVSELKLGIIIAEIQKVPTGIS